MARQATPQDGAPSPDIAVSDTDVQLASQSQQSFILQTLHGVSRDLGMVQEAVNTLKITAKEQGKSLIWVQRILWGAMGAFFIAAAVFGWIVSTGFDRIVDVLAKTN